MAVTITTVGGGSNLNDESPRWLDRAPSGRLWAVHKSGATIAFWYSDNNGTTWAQATGNVTDAATSDSGLAAAVALHIDLDGGLNIAYTSSAVGAAFRRGIVTGTTIAWTSTFALSGLGLISDVVAFRNPLTSGWIAYVAGRPGSGSENYPMVNKLLIAGTTITQSGAVVLIADSQAGSVGFGGGLDFHHTGDGKTVQGGTPHVYAIYFVTGGVAMSRIPEATVPTAALIAQTGTVGVASMVFDGTRIMFLDYNTTADTVTLYERDAGNTATIVRATTAALSAGISIRPRMTYDRDGNIHVVAIGGSDSDLWRNTWTRASNTWGGWTLEQTATATGISLRQGWAQTGFPTVEGLYKDATNLIYQEVTVLNATPSAPTVLTPVDGSTQDVAAALSIIWTFNDPDQGDAQTAYTVRKRIGAGAHTYWNGTTWAASESGATKIVSAVTSLAVGSGWGADGDSDHHYSVKTWDALDQLSPWSAEHRVVPSGKDNPTITIPVSDGTVMDSATETVEWTVATQTKFRLRVVGDIGGTPDLSVVDYDSGIKIGSAVRLDTVQFPTNGADRQIELTTWNDEGLASTLVYRLVDVSYTPPAVANVTLDVDSFVPGAIVVTIGNTGSGAVEDHNDIFRREVGDTGDGTRIAANVDVSGSITDYAVASGVDYEYQAKTYATSGALSFSAWIS